MLRYRYYLILRYIALMVLLTYPAFVDDIVVFSYTTVSIDANRTIVY